MSVPNETNCYSKSISRELYENLGYYFKYATSAYVYICLRPNGNNLVTEDHLSAQDSSQILSQMYMDSLLETTAVKKLLWLLGEDIIINVQVLLVPFEFPGVKLPPGTRVHSGFLVAWDSIGAEVVLAVGKQLLSHPGYSIVTTGHSLGGSLALLASVSLQQNFKTTPVRTYSYGAPRTGNKFFSDYVNATFGENAYRVVHGNDGVPTVIPRQLGYYHHGIEYWLYATPHSEQTTMKCDPEGEDPNGSASIPSQGVNLAHTTYFGILVGTPFCF